MKDSESNNTYILQGKQSLKGSDRAVLSKQ